MCWAFGDERVCAGKGLAAGGEAAPPCTAGAAHPPHSCFQGHVLDYPVGRYRDSLGHCDGEGVPRWLVGLQQVFESTGHQTLTH